MFAWNSWIRDFKKRSPISKILVNSCVCRIQKEWMVKCSTRVSRNHSTLKTLRKTEVSKGSSVIEWQMNKFLAEKLKEDIKKLQASPSERCSSLKYEWGYCTGAGNIHIVHTWVPFLWCTWPCSLLLFPSAHAKGMHHGYGPPFPEHFHHPARPEGRPGTYRGSALCFRQSQMWHFWSRLLQGITTCWKDWADGYTQAVPHGHLLHSYTLPPLQHPTNVKWTGTMEWHDTKMTLYLISMDETVRKKKKKKALCWAAIVLMVKA